MTLELPPNVKLCLDVDTTDNDFTVSESTGRMCESCAKEKSHGDCTPLPTIDGAKAGKSDSEIERLNGILKLTDQPVRRF
jgi:hypothetical protein